MNVSEKKVEISVKIVNKKKVDTKRRESGRGWVFGWRDEDGNDSGDDRVEIWIK